MSLSISDAGITVQITRETRSPSQRGFGSILVLDEVDPVVDRVKYYSSMASVAVDYQSTDEVYLAALAYYSQSPQPIDFYVGQYLTAEALGDVLDDIVTLNPEFYAVAHATGKEETATPMLAIATWVEANNRIFVTATSDVLTLDISDATCIAAQFKTNGYSRTMSIYSTDLDSYPQVAAFGLLATTSYRGTDTLKTLKFKDLATIPIENITPAGLQSIDDKNCNVFYETASIRMFDQGRMAAGSWIDEIVGTDALAEEIRVRVFGLLSRVSTKIPYNERGMAQLEAEVEASLAQYVTNGFLTSRVDTNGDILPAYTVWHIPVILASPTDKSNRIAPDIEFEARLAGAIHDILINGTLVLD